VRPARRQSAFLALLVVSLAAMVAFVLWRMSVELTEDQARAHAARLANQAFARETLLSPADRPVPSIVLVPESWRVAEKRDGRWHLEFGLPGGPHATVSFDSRGRQADVRVSFAPPP